MTLFRFNRKKIEGYNQVEIKTKEKIFFSDGFHIYDKEGKRVAIVHKTPKSKFIEIMLSNGFYIESMSSDEKIN